AYATEPVVGGMTLLAPKIKHKKKTQTKNTNYLYVISLNNTKAVKTLTFKKKKQNTTTKRCIYMLSPVH
ncbi:hypothetical protein, partial [Enterobacter asburiae]